MNHSTYRNPLNLSNSVDHEEIKKNGWLDQGALFVKVDDPRLTWVETELVRNLGNKLYGPRRKFD